MYSYYTLCSISVIIKNNITGVVSACANPVLYGLLNENFKTEYKNLLVAWREKLLEIKL
jgi:hypothetical protein